MPLQEADQDKQFVNASDADEDAEQKNVQAVAKVKSALELRIGLLELLTLARLRLTKAQLSLTYNLATSITELAGMMTHLGGAAELIRLNSNYRSEIDSDALGRRIQNIARDLQLLTTTLKSSRNDLAHRGRSEQPPVQELPTRMLSSLKRRLSSLINQLTNEIEPKAYAVGPTTYVQRLRFVVAETQPLTPDFLQADILPFLQAVSELQGFINRLRNEEAQPVEILLLRKGSLGINISGGAEAVSLIRDFVQPWRRDHAKQMANLQQQELRVRIAAEQAELDRVNQLSSVERGRTVAETTKLQADAEQAQLHNRMLRQELELAEIEYRRKLIEVENMKVALENRRLALMEEKFHIAMQLLDRIAPNLNPIERQTRLNQLVSTVDRVVSSPALLEDAK